MAVGVLGAMARHLTSIVVVALTCLSFASAAGAETPTVRVGFATPQNPSPLVGFTHGMSSSAPNDDLITPLRVGLWRSTLEDVPYKRTDRLGGRYTYVLSNRWGYPGYTFAPQAPYENWSKWRRFAADAARRGRKGNNVVWDVWNEPNDPYFWRGTREQLFETYRIAWEEIHRVLGPDAIVSGPSTSYYSPEWIGGLVEYCRAHGCKVDALSWHEFPSGSIPAIETRLDEAHERWVNHPRFAAVDIRQVHLNEVVAPKDQYLPAETLGYMRYMERGGVDAAARACWPGPDGADNCYNNTLAGLLTPGTFQTRSVWWATKAYADGAGSRVLTKFSDPYLVGIGSSTSASPNSAQLLLGNLERRVGTTRSKAATDVRVTFRKLSALGFLRGAKQVKVSIQRFPYNGGAPLRVPESRRGNVHTIRNGEVALTLHGVALHDAYRLVLARP